MYHNVDTVAIEKETPKDLTSNFFLNVPGQFSHFLEGWQA